MAAALASMVSSLPPSKASPNPEFEEMAKVANTKVKAWRRAARKGKGKNTAMMAPMFGTTWGEEFEISYGECAASASPTNQSRSLTGYPGNLQCLLAQGGNHLATWKPEDTIVQHT